MKTITLFGARHCFYCNVLKNKLEKGGYVFNFVDVSTPNGREIFKPYFEKYQCDDIPQIIVGKQILLPRKSFDTMDTAFELIEKLMRD